MPASYFCVKAFSETNMTEDPNSEPVDHGRLVARLVAARPIGIDSLSILKLRADIHLREPRKSQPLTHKTSDIPN